MKLLGREWYEVVTPEELAAIKAAMVSGPRGIATVGSYGTLGNE